MRMCEIFKIKCTKPLKSSTFSGLKEIVALTMLPAGLWEKLDSVLKLNEVSIVKKL